MQSMIVTETRVVLYFILDLFLQIYTKYGNASILNNPEYTTLKVYQVTQTRPEIGTASIPVVTKTELQMTN